jgi:ATP-dependent DNA ligase
MIPTLVPKPFHRDGWVLVAEADRIHAVRRLAPHGLKAWAHVLERGYEGLVAKDEASAYVGGRTRDWLKVKQENWTEGEHRWRRRLATTE